MNNFLIEHNIAFAASDHLSDLFKVIFPDSSIASKFASKRTKTTSIAKTLGQECKGVFPSIYLCFSCSVMYLALCKDLDL